MSGVALKGWLEKGRWKLQELAASQAKGGSLQGSGAFDPQASGSAGLNLSFKEWQLGERAFNGDFELEGSRPGTLRKWFKANR